MFVEEDILDNIMPKQTRAGKAFAREVSEGNEQTGLVLVGKPKGRDRRKTEFRERHESQKWNIQNKKARKRQRAKKTSPESTKFQKARKGIE